MKTEATKTFLPKEAEAKVSDLSVLRYENITIKLQAIELQFLLLQNQGQKLVDQQNSLLAQMRTEAGAEPDAMYNPATQSFQGS